MSQSDIHPPDTTAPAALFNEILACPRCDAAIQDGQCKGCAQHYPNLHSIPCLFPDPDFALTEWRARWQLALYDLQESSARAQADLKKTSNPLSIQRLQKLANAYSDQAKRIEALLQPLAVSGDAQKSTLLGLRTRLPSHHGVLAYEANIFRDWAWGDAENRAARALVLAAVGSRQPKRILVLGAGAGKLAYDCHQVLRPQLTVALDINPLLALLGQRLSEGEILSLQEFPRAPVNIESVAQLRELQAPASVAPGFHWVLADGLRPPFRAGAFDLIIAPWFSDIIDSSADNWLPGLNRLLENEGTFIHHGSMAFEQPDWSACHSLEEFEAAVNANGFEVHYKNESKLPYLNSPASRHGRIEQVVTLGARKKKNRKQAPRHYHLPAWLVDEKSPVPHTRAFQEQAEATRVHAYIMSLINGKRSIGDIAKLFEQQKLMKADDARGVLKGFFLKMVEEASARDRSRPTNPG